MAKYADLEANVAVTLDSTLGEKKKLSPNDESEKKKLSPNDESEKESSRW